MDGRIAVVLLLLAAGCGSAVPRGTVPRPADLGRGRPVEALLPGDTTTVVHVDLAGIRGSELYEVIGEDVASWGRALDEMGEEDGEAAAETEEEPDAEDFFDVAAAAEWIVFASAGTPSGDASSITFLGARLTAGRG